MEVFKTFPKDIKSKRIKRARDKVNATAAKDALKHFEYHRQ